MNLHIKFLRENLSLIVAIPTVLGGVWQMLQLISITPAFLRFFSLTQLISDGLFVGLMLFFAAIGPYSIAVRISNYMIKYLPPLLIHGIILFVSLSQLMLMYWDIQFEEKFFILNIGVSAFVFFLIITIASNHKLSEDVPPKFNKPFLTLFSFLLIPMIVGNTSVLVKEFSKSATNKIENLKVFEMKMRESYPNLKLEYFNDRYIFFQSDSTLIETTYLIRDMSKMVESDITDIQ